LNFKFNIITNFFYEKDAEKERKILFTYAPIQAEVLIQ